MKAFKLLAGLLAALLLLVIAAVLALVLLINPNTYKSKIEQQAAKNQVELHIDGDLGWSFYPSLGIHAGKFTLKPPLDAVRAPFRFDDLTVSVKLMPLLHRRVEIERVLLRGNELAFGSDDNSEVVIAHLVVDARDPNNEQRAFPLHIDADIHTPSLAEPVHVSADTQVALDAAMQHMALSALAMKIDDTQVDGQVDAVLGKTPSLHVRLNGSALDLDRYFPPAANAAHPATLSAAKTGTNEALIPVANIQAFPGDYEFTLKQLTTQRLHASDVAIAFTISRDAVLTLKQLQLHAYDGEVAMQATVDAHQAQPSVQVSLALRRLSVAPALRDYLQTDKPPLSGDVNLDAKLNTRGLTQEQLLQHLDGNFSVHADTLALENVNIANTLDTDVLQLLQAKLPALMSAKNQTALTQVEGEGNIQQGVINNTALTAKGLCSQFAGNGRYDLARHNLLYHLTLTFPSADTTQACGEVNAVLKDKTWPFICNGSLDNGAAKICGADKDAMRAILRDIAREKAADSLGKKLGVNIDSLKNAFKKLFH